MEEGKKVIAGYEILEAIQNTIEGIIYNGVNRLSGEKVLIKISRIMPSIPSSIFIGELEKLGIKVEI